MADETSRARSVRRITAPGNTGTYIDLKVIDEITFQETEPPYQEYVLKFQNNENDAARTVQVVEVGDDKLKVERIDTLDTTEETGIRHEAIWSFLNRQDPPVHLETHETTIYASDGNGNITDTGTWIKVQRIDGIEFEDPAGEVRNQESIWRLDNPDKQDANDDYKNLTPPVTTWDNTTINPPWRLDPFQTIIDCNFGAYMLVLYENNKIAWAPMSSISAPAGKFTSKTLAQSDWAMPSWWRGDVPSGWDAFRTPFRISAFQAKLSTVWHVMQANMSVSTQGVITIPASIEQTPVYNTKDTLLKKADSSTPRFTATGDTRFIYLNLAMNGENSTMYNDRGDKFTWSQSNGVLKESSYSDNYTDAYSQTMVMNVTKTGGRYSEILIELESNGYIKSYPITNSQSSAFSGVGSYADILGFFGPAESDFIHQTIPLDQGGTITTTAHISNYAKTIGGIDQINTGTTTVTYSFSPGDNYPLSGRYGDGWSYSIDGYFGYSNGRDYLDNNPGIWGAYPFPPSLGVTQDKVYYLSAERDTALPVNGFLQTPYERHNESAFMRNYFQFAPWLHISNGKHVIQAYDWTNSNTTTAHNTRIWLDGVNYGSTLASAIGCSVDDIRLILFDIKKSDIDKLK